MLPVVNENGMTAGPENYISESHNDKADEERQTCKQTKKNEYN